MGCWGTSKPSCPKVSRKLVNVLLMNPVYSSMRPQNKSSWVSNDPQVATTRLMHDITERAAKKS